jgi:hypothetical protein
MAHQEVESSSLSGGDNNLFANLIDPAEGLLSLVSDLRTRSTLFSGGSASVSKHQLSDALHGRIDGTTVPYVRFLSIPGLVISNSIPTKLRFLAVCSNELKLNQVPDKQMLPWFNRASYMGVLMASIP